MDSENRFRLPRAARRHALVGLAFTTATVSILACGGGNGPTPVVLSIEPAKAPRADGAIVQIVGTGFAEKVIPDAQNPDNSTVAPVRVRIGEKSIDATLTSSTALQATIPSNLAVGYHDVHVENPGGGASVLVGGYCAQDVLAALTDGTEPAPGDTNLVELTLSVSDGCGGALADAFTATLALEEPTSASIISGPASIAAGSTSTTITIENQLAETVTVNVTSTSPVSDPLPTALATFIAGPVQVIRIPGGEAGLAELISTEAHLEDADGNPSPSPELYIASPFLSGCTGTSVFSPDPIETAAGSSETLFSVSCDTVLTNGKVGLSVPNGSGWVVSSGTFVWN